MDFSSRNITKTITWDSDLSKVCLKGFKKQCNWFKEHDLWTPQYFSPSLMFVVHISHRLYMTKTGWDHFCCFVVVKTILIIKHGRYLNMQAFRLEKSNITTRRCFGVKNMLKQVNQKRTELMFMFEFFLLAHNIFMEDKTYGSFHYFSTQCCA